MTLTEFEESIGKLYEISQRVTYDGIPYTIGISMPVDGEGDMLAEVHANKMRSSGRLFYEEVCRESGEGTDEPYKLVLCEDNGLAGAWEDFQTDLESAGNPKNRTFVWLLKNEERELSGEYAATLASLQNTAHIVTLKTPGEHVPGWWQILVGPEIAHLIELKNAEEPDIDEIRKTADVVIESLSVMTMMTVEEFEKAHRKEVQELRSPDPVSLELFNGSFEIELPAIAPSRGIESLRKCEFLTGKAL